MLRHEEGLSSYADGSCDLCPKSNYCPGEGGQAFPCPPFSTTITPGRSKADCICLEGYYFASQEAWCVPCPRTRYKTAVGNGECSLTCPTNADSELASIGLDDCFCRPGFHAELVNGKLESCKSCSYQGLVCLGGWEGEDLNVSRIHAQPLAQRPGSKSPFLAFGFSPRPGF